VLSVAAVDVRSGRRHERDAHVPLPAASTIKVLISAALWSEACAGRIDPERRIRAGEWAYHMPLPSEPALSEWYGVSRTTIRSAARLLEERGMVEVISGRGTYVAWRPPSAS